MIALLVAVVMLHTPALMMLQAPDLVTVEKGNQSNVDEGRKVTVRTEAEWTRLWQQHNPDRTRPAVDFSKQMVVGVFMGSRSTAGFAIEIVSAAAVNGGLTVRYRETVPRRGAITAQVITSPYHLVAVPKVAGAVTFEKVE